MSAWRRVTTAFHDSFGGFRHIGRREPRTTYRAVGCFPVFFILTMLVCQISSVWAQTFRMFDGLPGAAAGSGEAFAQDGDGFMYAGDRTGLYVSSGGAFTRVATPQGDSFGAVRAIAAANDGTLMIAGASDFLVREYGRVVSAGLPASALSGPLPPQILAFQRGFVVLAGAGAVKGGGLWLVRPRGLAPEVESLSGTISTGVTAGGDVLSSRSLHGIFVDGDALWIGCGDEICRYRDGSITVFGVLAGVPPDAWTAFAGAPDGGVFARSISKFLRLNAEGHALVEKIPPPPQFFNDRSHRLFLVDAPGGSIVTPGGKSLIVRAPDGRWSEMSWRKDLQRPVVTSAFADREGGLWFGGLNQGAIRVAGFSFWHDYGAEEGFPAEPVSVVRRDSEGEIWVASRNGLLRYAARDGRVDESKAPARFDLHATSLTRTGDGAIWATLEKVGLARIEPATGRVTKFPTAAKLTGTTALDSAGRLWIGTTDGLARIDDPSSPPEHVPAPIALQGRKVNAIEFDQYGNVLALTDTVLFQRLSGERRFAPKVDIVELGIGAARTMTVTMSNEIWIAGEHGDLRKLTLSDDAGPGVAGFSQSRSAQSGGAALFRDSRGWIWIGGDGLDVLTPSGRRHFDTESGLVSNQISVHGVSEDDSGDIWVATDQGFSMLRVTGSLAPQPSLHTRIVSAELGQVDLTRAGRGWDDHDHRLRLAFVAPTFVGQRHLRYRYRLSALDDAIRETSRQDVEYPDFDGSRVAFDVQALDVSGGRAATPASILARRGGRAPPSSNVWVWSWGLGALALVGIGAVCRRAFLARQKNLEKLVRDRTRIMEEVQEQLIRQSRIDSLTGLLNRRAVLEEFDYLASGSGSDGVLAVVLIDLDHFKSINDSYGHQGGDCVLREYGERLRHQIRPGVFAGRYGGEELILVFSSTAGDAESVAADVDALHKVLKEPVMLEPERIIVTCSIGVAVRAPGDTVNALIGRADRALYRAKRGGRDRIVAAE
ncbi:ligand-binding sensor domain-containing diguanylate cyclase [Acetobacter nitrogenifigens]|uniref:diguanylate cyclase n=1 Tax=Acetobacter nitrogenifigens DSM 23921 = NBRC 105050 TaxID=1120919 RepID=A0A511X5S2_9PROT|nr:diguanylate cyclase [Acetobacter nitrogenifigens]GEN58270.1 GGDEF domain-containing protein [Acetobacter nitrogenifigens DSM 23921 = NBRC 105050]